MAVDYAKAIKCAVFSQQVYKPFQEVEFDGVVDPRPIGATSTDSYGVILPQGSDVTIAFRGSDSAMDWKTNFTTKPERVSFDQQVIRQEIVAKSKRIQVYPYKGPSKSGALMHSGFVAAYFSMRQQIQDYIGSQSSSQALTSVTTTGHSLGGALATLCAVDLQYNFSDLAIEVYTFGAPKVGNDGFCESFNRRVPSSYHFVNGMDIVPELPRWWQGYRDVKTTYRLGSRFSWNFLSARFKDHALDQYIVRLRAEAR